MDKRGARVRSRGLLFLWPSVIASWRAFRKKFNIVPTGRVPDRKSICLCMTTFMDTGSVKKKHDASFRIIIGPHFFEENEKTVRSILNVMQT